MRDHLFGDHPVLDLSLERLAQALAGIALRCATGLRCTDGLEGLAVGVYSKQNHESFNSKIGPTGPPPAAGEFKR